jgi:hypothetical protein
MAIERICTFQKKFIYEAGNMVGYSEQIKIMPFIMIVSGSTTLVVAVLP